MRIRILFVLISWIFGMSCHTSERSQLPKDLNQVMIYLDNDWNLFEKTRFKRMSESKAMVSTHRSTGLWIRNNWIRGDRNPPLIKYFDSLGVHSPDDISSIIMLSYHRRLNHRPLEVEGQIKEYKKYLNETRGCEEKYRAAALAVYNRHKVGDLITISMYVDTSSGNRNATVFLCPNTAWKFDPQKDLKINGTITNKYFINSPSNVFFTVKINKANLKNLQVLSDTLIIGRELDFSLGYLTVE